MPTRRNVLISFGELTDDQFFAFVNFLFDEDITVTNEDNRAIIQEMLDRGQRKSEPEPEPKPSSYVAVSKIIPSSSDPNKSYRVEKIVDENYTFGHYWTCECPDYQYRGGLGRDHQCKHIKKVRNW